MLNRQAIAIFVFLSILSSVTVADDAALMKEKCGICHGDDGNSPDEKVPSIASFTPDALQDMLNEYKEGERIADKYTPEGGKETDMGTVAKNLDEKDAVKIFQFISQQTFKPIKQAFDSEFAKTGKRIHKKKCEKCHSENGSSVEDDTPVLAGQWKAYLENEFAAISAGERDMPRKMMLRYKKLAANDYKALIEFYSSQQ